ncbi:MAG: HAD family hydrolase [Promethearchaeota archaeon]
MRSDNFLKPVASIEMHLEDLVKKFGIKAIVFDLDGTLTNTLDEHIEAFKRVFQKHGFDVDKSQIEKEMGRRPADVTRALIFNNKSNSELNTSDNNMLHQMAKEKVAVFKSLIPEHPPLMPGLPDLILKANKLGLKLAVCSSTPLENVRLILERIQLLKYFDVLVTAEDVSIGKPHPESFLKAVEKLRVNKSEVFVIGDSVYDIESANNAGLKIIAVATGKHSIQELKGAGAEIVVENLSRII